MNETKNDAGAKVDAGGTDGAVTDVPPGSVGRWHIRTRNTLHVLDLDAFTYERIASSSSGVFDTDGAVHRLNRIEMWPRVGQRMLVWFDDPTNPSMVERWHATSAVIRIERAEHTEVASAARDSGEHRSPDQPAPSSDPDV